MIDVGEPPTMALRHDGEPCPRCGAPLAADQRYCLHCGVRRPEARVAFLDVLSEDARRLPVGPGAPAATAAVDGGVNGWVRANSGALALSALLLLMLLIGLLVGHWATATTPATAPAAAPQVIRVEGAASAAPAASSASPAATGGGSGGGATSKAKHATSKAKAKGAPKGAVSVKSLSDKKALDQAVKKGKPIATPGAPPPKDNKPAGGGSNFQTIG